MKTHRLRGLISWLDILSCVAWVLVPGVVWAYPRGYEGHQLVKVTITNNAQLQTLLGLEGRDRDVEIWSDYPRIGVVDVRVSPQGKRRVEAAGLECRVVIEELQRHFDELFSAPADAGFFEAYRGYDEHVAFMNELVANHPDLARMVNLGLSVEGRALWAIRITGPGTDKPGVMFHGAQHGDEIMGAPVIAYAAQELLGNYDSDPETANLVDSVEWFLLPIMNPDGYEAGRRHNANYYDLNRNWGGPGSRPDAFSQPETAAMRDFFLGHPNIRAHLDLHMSGNMIMWPWGHTEDLCEDDATFNILTNEMADAIFRVQGTTYPEIGPLNTTIYPVGGGSIDYTYGEFGILAFTFEIGGRFYVPKPEIMLKIRELLPAMRFLAGWTASCPEVRAPVASETVLFVDADSTGAVRDGLSWDTAYVGLRDAVLRTFCTPGTVSEIWVAEGVYRPDRGTGHRYATFQMVNGVGIYGGFAGWETSRDQRAPDANVTILSGDLDGDDTESACKQDLPDCDELGWRCIDGTCLAKQGTTENSYTVVTARHVDAAAILDGVTITAGYADGEPTGGSLSSNSNSGGMHIYRGNPTLINCRFTQNGVAHRGGGVSCVGADPTLIKCSFTYNWASRGGGLYADGFWLQADPTWIESRPRLINCLFVGNSGTRGGAMYYQPGTPTLVNCTIVGNFAVLGGGVFGADGAIIRNCVFWGNRNQEGMDWEAQILGDLNALTNVSYNTIQGWEGAWPLQHNVATDPLFVDPLGPDGIAGTEDDDLHLSAYSPAIGAGDPAYVPDPEDTDLDGNPRLRGCRLDMGAYEAPAEQLPGDYDGNGRVDLADLAGFQLCMGVQTAKPDWLETCLCLFDADQSGDIDLTDFPPFSEAFNEAAE